MKGGEHLLVTLTALDSRGALPGSGQHLDRLEQLGDLLAQTEAGQAGGGEHDGVELALVGADHGQAGAEVAADVAELQTKAEGRELRAAARRAGPDDRTLAELTRG